MTYDLTPDASGEQPAVPHDGGPAAPPTNPTPKRRVSIDTEKYARYLDDADLTEDEKRQFLEALWTIIVCFVDLGFTVESAEQNKNIRSQNPPSMLELKDKSDSKSRGSPRPEGALP